MAAKRRSKAQPADAQMQAAIEYAEKYAGKDDKLFIEMLNEHYRRSQQPPAGRQRTIAIKPEPPPPIRSFQIYADPRYLANARELTRRTQGGYRVIGGAPVKPGEFLDCVAVGSDAQWGCTGTLIAADVVLTAGHCADFATRIFIGSDVTKAGKVVAVKKRVRHPKYHRGGHHDVMVLLLDTPVTTVQPRPLATKARIDKATDGRVMGFGHSDPMGRFGYGRKRFVDIPIASPACRGRIGGQDDRYAYGCDPGLELVAGRPMLERDSCKGDSGGPFYVAGKQDGDWLLAAATSRATDSAMHECGDGGIYARVDAYREWITSIPGVKLP
jgi:hypothetical protein